MSRQGSEAGELVRERACRICGCTDDLACEGGCYWVEDPEGKGNLCSQCLPKAALIQEIEAIYRDHNYRPRGKPLADYSEEQLRAHLAKLQAGAYEWMKGGRERATGGGAGATPSPIA